MAQIKAGSVAVEIIGDDANFKKAIEGVEKAVKNIKFPGFAGFHAQVRDATMTFVAAKSVIQDVSGALTGVFTDFASFGDQFSKAAQRTGANAAWLSEIGYAAEQSGASLDAVGNGFKYLSKNFDLALRGGKQAAESFERLGLSVGQLAAMTAEERFLAVADALNQIKDESLQSAAAMAKSALLDLGTEIIEAKQNLKSITEAQKSLGNNPYSISADFRELFVWASGGYVDSYEDQMKKLDDQMRLQQKKLWAAQEKQHLIEGGMNPLDAAKDPKALLQEQVAEGAVEKDNGIKDAGIKEQENAEKRLADIQREIEKSRNSALLNEIEQLKERNEEQKKYLDLLIAAEKEKPLSNAEKIAEWTKAKDQADADLKRSLDDLLQQTKEDENRFGSEQLDFLKLFDQRNQAAQAGDAAGYQKAKQELDALKKLYEQTQMKNLRQNLGTAVDEVKKYQNALDQAVTTEEKIIAEQQLQAAKEHAAKLYEQYDQIGEQMSQKQFDDLQVKNNVEGKKAETPGNSSAFVYGTKEFYEYMAKAQNPQLKEAQKQTIKLASIDETNKKTNRLLEDIGVV